MDFVRAHLLEIEGLILFTVALVYWMEDRTTKIVSKVLNMLMLVLVAGIPIVYSSATRSVFEVNKLFLLRFVLILGFGVWASRSILLSTQEIPERDSESVKQFTTSKFKILGAVTSILLMYAFVSQMGMGWKILGVVIMFVFMMVLPSLGDRWKWTGLEWAFLVWMLINSLATIFSHTPQVSVIGAYDRWEGIITVSNYAVLVWMYTQLITNKKTLYLIIGGVLIPTTLSAIYGIFQSFGVDFMRWSADPTSRVFASINNPVHFSAYVGMLVPVGLGFLLHLSSIRKEDEAINEKLKILKWVVYVSTFLCYYALYLSFSRAATLGFVASTTIFYLFALNLINIQNRKHLVIDFFFTSAFIALFYIDYIFTFFKHGSLGIYAQIISGLFFVGYMLYQVLSDENRSKEKAIVNFLAGFALVATFFLDGRFGFLSEGFFNQLIRFSIFALAIGLTAFSYVKNGSDGVKCLLKLMVIYLFAKLQFVVIGWTDISIYLVAMIAIYLLSHEKEDFSIKASAKLFGAVLLIPTVIIFLFERMFISTEIISKEFGVLLMNSTFLVSASIYLFMYLIKDVKYEKLNMLISFVILFATIVFVPSFSEKVTDLFAAKGEDSKVISKIATGKISSYEQVAIKGTARTSMWKTALGWGGIPFLSVQKGKMLHSTAWINGPDFSEKIESFPVLGTGLDTIKELYPRYRRPDYGRLEGGHNFTPDRVHNEYLNTLATTGIVGFVVRWFWIIGGFLVIALFGLYRHRTNPMFYLLLGTSTGMMVHLGQLNFNFSVVATAVLFYVLIGVSLAMCNMSFTDEGEVVEVVDAAVDKKLINPYFEQPFDFTKVGTFAWVKIGVLWCVMIFFVWQSVNPWMAEWYYRQGYNAFAQKRYQDAIFYLDIACDYAPWETHYRVQLGKAYEENGNRQSSKAEKLKQYEKAEKEYNQIIAISKYNPWYINRLANVYLQYHNLYTEQKAKNEYRNKAAAMLQKASETDKNNPLFHMSYAFFLQRVGAYDEALKEYQEVLRIDDRMNEARFNTADIYRIKGDIDGAVALYEEIIERDEKFRNVHTNLGRIYFSQKKYKEAIFSFEKAIINNPKDFSAYRNLGASYHQLKNWNKAISTYKRALRISPNDQQTRRYLGHAYYNAGYIESAINELEKVLKLSPNDKQLIQNINAMKLRLKRK